MALIWSTFFPPQFFCSMSTIMSALETASPKGKNSYPSFNGKDKGVFVAIFMFQIFSGKFLTLAPKPPSLLASLD
ncbi:hypothetical protein CDV54_14475 [Paracoccus yeei]|nr:hypothetical protein CDV54_14475 [Paracoccus yeei]